MGLMTRGTMARTIDSVSTDIPYIVSPLVAYKQLEYHITAITGSACLEIPNEEVESTEIDRNVVTLTFHIPHNKIKSLEKLENFYEFPLLTMPISKIVKLAGFRHTYRRRILQWFLWHKIYHNKHMSTNEIGLFIAFCCKTVTLLYGGLYDGKIEATGIDDETYLVKYHVGMNGFIYELTSY